MRASRLFFWVILIIFLYQNCEVNEDATLEKCELATQEECDQLKAENLEPVVELGEANLEKPLSILVEDNALIIHLESGTIIGSEERDQINYCLSTEKLDELKTLLTDIKICQLNNEVAEDMVCTMEYVFPFAGVFVENEIAIRKIGEKTSSCPKKTVEFCSNHSEIESLVLSLDFTADFALCQGNISDIPLFELKPFNQVGKNGPLFTY